MTELLVVVAVVALAGAAWWYRRWAGHEVALSRVDPRGGEEHVRVIHLDPIQPAWTILLPWVLGLLALMAAVVFTPLGALICGSIGFLFWVVGFIVAGTIVSKRVLTLEAQLATAIDHVVTSLHAGMGVIDALGRAERDARYPLKPHLGHFLMRVRLGDDASEVCREMAEIIPLESFRLYYYALGVQWEGGGSLGPTLMTTGRFIRERVDLGRRVRAHTVEARFSVFVILLVTYFLAFLMWNVNPARMAGFAGVPIGQLLIATALVLQGVGAAWVAWMSRVRF